MTKAFLPGNVWKSKDASMTMTIIEENGDTVKVFVEEDGQEIEVECAELARNHILIKDNL